MAQPTLASYQQSTWSGSSSASEVTATVTWSTGDLVVVLGATDDNVNTLALQNVTGLTFSPVTGSPSNVASSAKVYGWSAIATAGGSSALTATVDGSTAARGLSVFVFSGSDGVGGVSVSGALDATTTQSLTRTGANSHVVQAWSDWNAVNDTTVTWTPTGETQRVAQFVGGRATFFVANWGDQGASGSTNYGFSGFSGGDFSAITLEVLGTTAGGTAEKNVTDSLTLVLVDSSIPILSLYGTDSSNVQASEVAGALPVVAASDSVTVRLNGADTSGSTSELSISDSLSIVASGVSDIANTFSVTDSLTSGLTDSISNVSTALTTTDACAAQLAGSAVIANLFVLSDILTAGLSDVFAGSHAFSVVEQLATQLTSTSDAVVSASVIDSAAAGLTDIGLLSQVTVSAFDSLAIQLSATSNVLQNSLITASDSLIVQASGLADIGNAWTVNETAAVQLTDQFTGSHALAVADSVLADLTESNSVDVQAVASDSAVSGTEDDGSISQATVSATDDLAAGTLESSNVIQNALIEAPDSCAVKADDQAQIGLTFSVLDDVSAGLEDAVTGEHAASTGDEVSASVDAIAFGFAQTDTTESFQVQTSESLAADIAFSSIDELVAQLEDLGSRQDVDEAIQKSASDALQMLIEDGSVTEPAGPYWGGWTGTEYAIVHADSYEMGRKENPSRMRW